MKDFRSERAARPGLLHSVLCGMVARSGRLDETAVEAPERVNKFETLSFSILCTPLSRRGAGTGRVDSWQGHQRHGSSYFLCDT